MIRNRLQQFMIGRNGADHLALTVFTVSLVLQVIQSFFGGLFLYTLSLVLLIYSFFRMFSRNVEKRRAENSRFLTAVRPLRRRMSTLRARAKDKDHRYFRCPNCKQQMRVPRGKGRIRVTCRACGASFEQKS